MADGPVDSLHSRRPEEAGSGSPSRELTEAPSPGAGQAASDPSVSLSGTTVDHFEVLELLGAGGFGEVYRARDTRLGRMVAIKVLPAAFAKDAERRERFRREALAASALNHPNICTVHDLVEEDGRYFIVMELVEGKTLAATLKDGPLSLERLLPIALQVAEALGEAHRAGILHRDIKPGNIALTARGQVKVLDFGLAKLVGSSTDSEEPTLESLTAEGATSGTLEYMSPEQLLGKPLDGRSDLFSFGIVLYAMVTGRRPFEGNSAIALANAILYSEPRDFGVAPVPEKLKAIVRRLLEKEPEKRYASAEQVHAELRALGESLAPTRKAGLSRSVRIVLIAASLVVVAAAGWLGHRWSRERWARETAAPEVARLIAMEEFKKAAALLGEARAILPRDPALEKLWKQATVEVSAESVPPGAEVSIRPYRGDSKAWESLGKTPLKKVRIPRNYYVWRASMPKHADAYDIDPLDITHDRPVEMSFRLAREESVPPGMILVPGGGEKVSVWMPGYFGPEIPLDDYFIDLHEVTNEEYRKFVEAGGYQRRDYWKQPFVREGKAIPWEKAIALFLDATGRPGPAAWEAGSFPAGKQRHPVAGVSWYEAAAYAEFAGKSLPTIHHWYLVAALEAAMLIVPGSNFRGEGTVPVGGAGALSWLGATDMAGNVKEWCWNQGRGETRMILGGGFGEPDYMFHEADAQSPWHRSPNYGFRCVKLSSMPPPAALARVEPEFRDYSKEKPVSDDVFQVFRRLYAYDKGPLDARVEETETTEDWTRQKVSFKAAYGEERVVAHLYLPRNAAPPYQTLVYYPGSGSQHQDQFNTAYFGGNDFVPKCGRALMFPVYKGTYERRDASGPGSDVRPEAWYRQRAIAQSNDLGRSLDYLETRHDIDSTKLAYSGYSWGAHFGLVLLAVEPRFKTAILAAGGLPLTSIGPERDRINFVTRVRIPVLMLNGRYDSFFPVESSQRPLFRLLGTQEKDKKHVLFDVGHVPPNRHAIREILAWLDRYLGPVKR